MLFKNKNTTPNSYQELPGEMPASPNINEPNQTDKRRQQSQTALLITKNDAEFRKFKEKLRAGGALTNFGTTSYIKEIMSDLDKNEDIKKCSTATKKAPRWNELTEEKRKILLPSIYHCASKSESKIQDLPSPITLAISYELCFPSSSKPRRTISARRPLGAMSAKLASPKPRKNISARKIPRVISARLA
mmetsp:Transcript_29526/g.42869  ORF Transcript_29526/g.42869 Transcript_29526/m.42869 type:complete len:190 (+) Transcript_29526:275-844(+)